jgi:hypothetical protein
MREKYCTKCGAALSDEVQDTLVKLLEDLELRDEIMKLIEAKMEKEQTIKTVAPPDIATPVMCKGCGLVHSKIDTYCKECGTSLSNEAQEKQNPLERDLHKLELYDEIQKQVEKLFEEKMREMMSSSLVDNMDGVSMNLASK